MDVQTCLRCVEYTANVSQGGMILKITTIVGARPQFVKAGMLSRTLRKHVQEVIIHTGQHYDDNMSKVFFDQLGIPKPDYELHVGSGSHAAQTAAMIVKIEDILLKDTPDWVLVYGDTNSTLAGSLAAAKLNIKVAHVEAGLRSYNRAMPEEINRVLTDHLSSLLFCPTDTAVANLAHEGIQEGVHQVGDIMCDALMFFKQQAAHFALPSHLTLNKPYAVATVHRAENTDNRERLRHILHALSQLDVTVVLPLHPRTQAAIQHFGYGDLLHSGAIQPCAPLSYFEMLKLVSGAKLVLTDSGGVQKEAYMLGVPCLTLRDETEWPETVQAGWNRLTGANTANILNAARTVKTPSAWPPLFGNGKSAEKMTSILLQQTK